MKYFASQIISHFKPRVALVLFSLFNMSASYAYLNPGQIRLYISGGATINTLNNQTNVVVANNVINSYKTQQQTNWDGIGGVGIGYAFHHLFNLPSAYQVVLGVSGYILNLNTIEGIEHPFSNAGSFDTLNYNFHAKSYALMFEPRLVYTCWNWQPYVLAGIGAAWNYLYDYSESPSNPNSSAAATPFPFTNKTTSQFAYEFGIGVQKNMWVDIRNRIKYDGSLDYRYFNLGKASLGSSRALANGIQVNPVYTNTILFSLNVSCI